MLAFFNNNAVFALLAALLWGGGDFSGGMGVKGAGGSMRSALRVVLASHATSFLVLLLLIRIFHEPLPHGAPLVWSLAAGVFGGLSLVCFYTALSHGAMGASAAVSGMLAAAIPAAVAIYADGSPGPLKLLGFFVAAVAIWLIAGATTHDSPLFSRTMLLAIIAGTGFGLYFVSLKFAGTSGVVWPMTIARIGSLVFLSIILLALTASNRTAEPLLLPRKAFLWAVSTAVLDTSGNMFYIAATRAGRLDVAAVLASLYPASTILLAAWMLHERPTRRQALGMGIAVAAVVMIAL